MENLVPRLLWQGTSANERSGVLSTYRVVLGKSEHVHVEVQFVDLLEYLGWRYISREEKAETMLCVLEDAVIALAEELQGVKRKNVELQSILPESQKT